MNNYNANLCDMIYVNESFIPPDVCDFIIEKIESRNWDKHSWNNGKDDINFSYPSKELSIQMSTPDLSMEIIPYVTKSFSNYFDNYFFDSENNKNLINKFSIPRFNRYSKGELMRQHCDHISTLFDGNERGIPVLSCILNFNDNYSGGQLYFWEDYELSLGKGDIVFFPSGFLYPHGVREIAEGIRYSSVIWFW